MALYAVFLSELKMYSGKDKYTARHIKTERPATAKIPRELDQYIVDPMTKKRYLRGRFLGKVPTARSIQRNRHLNLNPATSRANESLIAQVQVLNWCVYYSCFFLYREGLQNATSSPTWKRKRSSRARSSRK